MNAYQTVAAGTPPAGRWASLGFASVPVAFDLDTVFGMLVGEQNSGKSYLAQSNPNAFIINADDSPIVNPHGQACIWPARDTDGRIIDLDGKPMVLTWDAIEKKRQQLIQMAKDNVDRPRTVVLDTIFPVMRLLKQHVVAHFNKTEWEQLHGPMAYEKVYSILIEFALSLRSHGYGVWFVAHLSKRWVSLSETSNIQEYALYMSEGLRERLSKTVELIAPVRAMNSTKVVTSDKTINVGGKEVVRKVTNEVPYTRRYLAFNDPEFANIIRTRTLKPLPDIDLDGPNPWETFSQAFSNAVSVSSDSGESHE